MADGSKGAECSVPPCREVCAIVKSLCQCNAAFVPLVVVAAAVVLQIGGVKLPVVGRGWARFDPACWPVALLPKLDEINRSAADGTPIFNDLNFGGFLIYHEPRLRVFVDDRCSLYGTEFLQAYDHARREAPAEIDRWQRQYGFRYALVETGGQFDRYLSSIPPGPCWAARPRQRCMSGDVGVPRHDTLELNRIQPPPRISP